MESVLIVFLVAVLVSTPVMVCMWWLARSKRDEQRKEQAFAKMERLYGPRPERQHTAA